MTRTAEPRTAACLTPPRLAAAIGLPRLTAAARGDGIAASWEEHVATHGEPATRQRAATVTGLLSQHGVLGRGGAGFPLLVKLQAVAAAKGRPVVVVNASEGEPAIWKDRLLLAHVPHLVLDGAQLAAAALGADRIHVAVNPTYAPARHALSHALTERAGRARDVADVRVQLVPDAFTAGEATSVVRLLNGGPARPEFTTVITAVRGVAGRPTLLSNAETFAQLALLARLEDQYGAVGAPGEPGTALFTLRGAVPEEVVLEAALGTTVGELLTAAGGPTEPLQAVLLGGYHGRWMSVDDAWQAPLAVAELRARGGSLGAGLVAALPADTCPLLEVARVVDYLATQTAGQCGPCINGLPAIASELADLALGLADSRSLDRLAHWSGLVRGRGNCKHPDGTVGFVASALEVFGDHVERHLAGPCGLPWRRILPVL